MADEQLSIEVTPAPGAIGRWELEHELAAYSERMGQEALDRQRRLAEEAKDCTCGQQEKADQEAVESGQRPKKLRGHQHKPGCKSYARPALKLAARISAAEQRARYDDEQRVHQLRQALDRARAVDDPEPNPEGSTS